MSIYVFQFMFTVFTLRIVAALTQFFVNFCRLHYVISRFLRNVWLEVMDCPVTYFAAEATRSTGASCATGL